MPSVVTEGSKSIGSNFQNIVLLASVKWSTFLVILVALTLVGIGIYFVVASIRRYRISVQYTGLVESYKQKTTDHAKKT